MKFQSWRQTFHTQIPIPGQDDDDIALLVLESWQEVERSSRLQERCIYIKSPIRRIVDGSCGIRKQRKTDSPFPCCSRGRLLLPSCQNTPTNAGGPLKATWGNEELIYIHQSHKSSPFASRTNPPFLCARKTSHFHPSPFSSCYDGFRMQPKCISRKWSLACDGGVGIAERQEENHRQGKNNTSSQISICSGPRGTGPLSPRDAAAHCLVK